MIEFIIGIAAAYFIVGALFAGKKVTKQFKKNMPPPNDFKF